MVIPRRATTATTATTAPTAMPAIAPLLSPPEEDCEPSAVGEDVCDGALTSVVITSGAANAAVVVAAMVDVAVKDVGDTVDVAAEDVVDNVVVDPEDVVDSVDVAVENAEAVVALAVELEVDPQIAGSSSEWYSTKKNWLRYFPSPPSSGSQYIKLNWP